MKTYLLSEIAKPVTWKQWKKLRGCGLSGPTECAVARQVGPLRRDRDITLGQLQDACIVAGREIARFAKDHLNKPEWAVVEYENA